MDLRPEYQTTSAGCLPQDWEVKPLGTVLRNARLGGNYANQEAETDFPLMKMGNIARGCFECSKVEYIARSQQPEDQHRLAHGDVLFNTRNTLDLVGKVAIWRNELPLAYYNSNLMRLEFDPGEIVSNDYANYALNAYSTVASLRAMATGTTSVAAIYTRDLLELPFVVPPKEEQRVIAGALSDVDALLNGLKRLIAKNRDLKQAAMQQLLTGRTRLPGFTSEWRVRRLGDHATFLKSGAYARAELSSARGVKYLHYGDIHVASDVRLDARATTMPFLDESRAYRLDGLIDGDVVFVDASEDVIGVGKSVEILHADEVRLVAGLHTIAVRFDKTVLADGFKAYLQCCPPFVAHLRRLAAGTKVYATTRGHIAGVKMPLPDVQEQTAIATVLSDMDAELAALEARRAKTQALKQAMMQALLTGRIRLVTPEPAHA